MGRSKLNIIPCVLREEEEKERERERHTEIIVNLIKKRSNSQLVYRKHCIQMQPTIMRTSPARRTQSRMGSHYTMPPILYVSSTAQSSEKVLLARSAFPC